MFKKIMDKLKKKKEIPKKAVQTVGASSSVGARVNTRAANLHTMFDYNEDVFEETKKEKIVETKVQSEFFIPKFAKSSEETRTETNYTQTENNNRSSYSSSDSGSSSGDSSYSSSSD